MGGGVWTVLGLGRKMNFLRGGTGLPGNQELRGGTVTPGEDGLSFPSLCLSPPAVIDCLSFKVTFEL